MLRSTYSGVQISASAAPPAAPIAEMAPTTSALPPIAADCNVARAPPALTHPAAYAPANAPPATGPAADNPSPTNTTYGSASPRTAAPPMTRSGNIFLSPLIECECCRVTNLIVYSKRLELANYI